ncbi:hypothetical protein CFP56_001505 [Quercus suber]|uniref:Bacterial Ig-like domain-containing protein n=1 Tax=Quercus suber TaxID=58331 RepID=A0AAW0LIC4_QUESU
MFIWLGPHNNRLINLLVQLDDGSGSIIASECENGTVLCEGLQDGNHKFEVCPNGSQGVGCSSYNWTVDTVPPTADITASTNFTNALNVPINISFSEPCTGGPGFVCSSVNACNLLVHGAGKVIPNSLKILQPNLQYSVLVGLSSTAQYGRVNLVMGKNFCTDSAGNKFERNKNSYFTLRFDRRPMVVNLTTHVSERQVVLGDVNGETRLVRATNNCVKLRICLTFLVPVLNSSAEILKSLEPKILYSLPKRQGKLLPLNVSKDDPGHRRFEFMVDGCISGMAIVTVGIDENSITSIHGTPVSYLVRLTIVYKYSLRPAPMLITPPSDYLTPEIRLSTLPLDFLGPDVNLTTLLHMRTREHNIFMWIEFKEPVFDFNSSDILIKGGELARQVISVITIFSFEGGEGERKYAVEINVTDDVVSVKVPENVAHDVAGNKNLASETLLVRPYSVPIISTVISTFATASFVATSIAAGLLTASTASLSSIGTFSPPFSSLSDPANSLRPAPMLIKPPSDSLMPDIRLSTPPSDSLGPDVNLTTLLHEDKRTQHLYVDRIHGAFITIFSFEPKSERKYAVVIRAFHDHDFVFVNVPENVTHDVAGNKNQASETLLVRPYSVPIISTVISTFATASFVATSIATGLLAASTASLSSIGTFPPTFSSLSDPASNLFSSRGLTNTRHCKINKEYFKSWECEYSITLLLCFLNFSMARSKALHTRSSTVATPAVPLTSSTSAHTHGDYQIIAPDDKTEEVEVSRGSVPTHAEASPIQNLFMQLRIYYTLIESVRRVLLGAMGGAYKNTWSSTIPTIILLCITSLQLFFLVLEKPFIKRRVQLVEIISVASEVCLFALFLVLVDKELSPKQETIVGVSMLVLFLMGFLPQIANQLYALRRQIKHLDTTEMRFRTGLRIASFGILLFFISQDSLEKLDCFGDNEPNDTGGQRDEESTNDTGGQRDEESNATERNRNSGRRNKNPKNRNRNSETTVPEKSWLNQLVKVVTNCLGIA